MGSTADSSSATRRARSRVRWKSTPITVNLEMLSRDQRSRRSTSHEATRDRMHQPYRGDPSGFPLSRLLKAAQEAGAHGSFMSGAGPTVLAFAGGYAMESKAS